MKRGSLLDSEMSFPQFVRLPRVLRRHIMFYTYTLRDLARFSATCVEMRNWIEEEPFRAEWIHRKSDESWADELCAIHQSKQFACPRGSPTSRQRTAYHWLISRWTFYWPPNKEFGMFTRLVYYHCNEACLCVLLKIQSKDNIEDCLFAAQIIDNGQMLSLLYQVFASLHSGIQADFHKCILADAIKCVQVILDIKDDLDLDIAFRNAYECRSMNVLRLLAQRGAWYDPITESPSPDIQTFIASVGKLLDC